MAVIEKAEEDCNSEIQLTMVGNDVVENKRLKLDTEKTMKKQLDFAPKDTGWAWMCCLGCFLQCVISGGCVVKCFGIMFVAFMETFNSRAWSAALVVLVFNFTSTFGGAFTNGLAMRFTSRAVVFTGGLFLSLGFITSMFATRLSHLFFTYGFLLGFGNAMAYSVSISHMGQYFRKRRAIANGIALSGFAFGSVVMPPVLRMLTDTYGLHGAMLIMAGISLNVCVAGALLRPVSAYSQKERPNNNSEKIVSNNAKNDEEDTWQKSTQKGFRRVAEFLKSLFNVYALLEWSLLKRRSFLLIGISLGLFAAGLPSYFVIFAAYVEEAGHSKRDAAILLSVQGLGDIPARILFGVLADTHIIQTHLLLGLTFFLTAIFALLTPFITDLIALGVMGVSFGMFAGPVWSLYPTLLGEILKVHQLQSALGIIQICIGIGLVIGTPLAGLLRDITGEWKASFFFSSFMILLSATVMLLRSFVTKPRSEDAD